MKRKWGWYRRRPDRALEGMEKLTPEQRGVYNTLLDLLYLNNGDLDDADQWLAKKNNCDIRVYRRIKRELMDCGKVWVLNGKILTKGLSYEISYRLSYAVSSTENSGDESSENNEMSEPSETESKSPRIHKVESLVDRGATTTVDFLKMIEGRKMETLLDEQSMQDGRDQVGRKDFQGVMERFGRFIRSPKCRRPPTDMGALNRLFVSFCKAEGQGKGNHHG